MQVGDWVEGDNGYGVIVKLFPKYYQYWDSIPAEKKAGDKEQDDVVIKRFCSFDFKVYPQTQLNSMKYISKVSKKEMETINKLLKDEKKAKRYEKYKTEEISEICNWNLKIAVTKIKTIHAALEQLENNGNLI